MPTAKGVGERANRIFANSKLSGLPQCVCRKHSLNGSFSGTNGAGKTTFFDVFGFLHDCLNSNVRSALAMRSGFNEVISRDQTDDMQFTVKFRPSPNEPIITYELAIGLNERSAPVVKKEVMRFRRGQHGAPWKILDFSYGEGVATKGMLVLIDGDAARNLFSLFLEEE